MVITRRYIYLLGLGIPIVALGLIFHNPLTLFIIYNFICFALFAIDYYTSSSDEETLSIVRLGDNKLSIYENEALSFEIYNKSSRSIYIELRDEIPEFHFNTENKVIKALVLPHERKILQYYVMPTKRGAFIFANIHIRYMGRFKLCMRMYKLDLSREYKVYPNLKNLHKYRLSLYNNRMLKEGQRNLRMLGHGTSFESLREYVPGDEYRKINWKATARGNKPIVNQYEPEKNQHVYMFIDTGRPMSYTVRGYRKLDMAVNTALVLADLVNQNDDQAALLLFNTEVNNMIMPGKGAGHRNKILEALYHIDYNNDTSNYEDAFYYFKKKERHRSIIFLFTDFETVEEAESLIKVTPIIGRNNIVIIILIRNEKLEVIASQKVNNEKDIFDKGVALELIEERKRIIDLLNRKGVYCIECAAEQVEIAVINKYIQIKNRNI